MGSACNSACKTWFFRVLEFYSKIGHDVICRDRDLSVRVVLTSVDSKLLQYYKTQWQEKLNSDNAIRGPTAGGNKLRTYRTFKKHYCTEPYVEVITAKRYQSANAKFRCGVAPIKIETCRYGLNRVPVDQRVCHICSGVSRISFRGGGGFKLFLEKWGYLHGAKRHAFARGVRGHAPPPPRNFLKMVQFDAF